MRFKILISLVIVMLFVSFTANAALNMKDKTCLLYLSCNELNNNKGLTDSSSNKSDGTIVGTVNLVDGKFGKALQFAEAGEVKCPYIPLNNKSFTVCLWMNPKLAGGDQQCVFSQTDANATNTSMHFRIYNTGVVRMGFYSNDLDAPASSVKANEWAHICYLVDVAGKTRKIYVNGVQVAKDAGVVGVEYLGKKGDTMVGSWGATGQKFNGMIDEVQVWDKALSEAEIKDSMANLSATSATSVGSADKLTSTWGSIKY